jgi:hypothetical protein
VDVDVHAAGQHQSLTAVDLGGRGEVRVRGCDDCDPARRHSHLARCRFPPREGDPATEDGVEMLLHGFLAS